MEKQKYDEAQVDKLHYEVINHQTDISNHQKLMDSKVASIENARKLGYKNPLERLEEEQVANRAEKKRREEERAKIEAAENKKAKEAEKEAAGES